MGLKIDTKPSNTTNLGGNRNHWIWKGSRNSHFSMISFYSYLAQSLRNTTNRRAVGNKVLSKHHFRVVCILGEGTHSEQLGNMSLESKNKCHLCELEKGAIPRLLLSFIKTAFVWNMFVGSPSHMDSIVLIVFLWMWVSSPYINFGLLIWEVLPYAIYGIGAFIKRLFSRMLVWSWKISSSW